MAEKATALNIRHELFVFLQKARDRAKADHPNCSRQVRSYIADLDAWEHFCQYNSLFNL